MRKLSANYIFDGFKLHKNAILYIDDNGKIIDFITGNESLKEENKLEFYNGILCPGFVNAHCHLELSHLKNKIDKHKTLPGFIKEIIKLREISSNEKDMLKADEQMINEGIVAVGDISNTNKSFKIKAESKIKYHTFIELTGPDKYKFDEVYEKAKKLKSDADNLSLKNNFVPHAPYSVSTKILELVKDDGYKTNSIISIHNQETESENTMFLEAKGKLLDTLKDINPYYKSFKPTYFNSLPSTLIHLPKCNKTMLVHSTYTSQKDIKWTNDYTKYAYWCMCPNSNLYIENKLPDINLFINEKVCIGTDSLASNEKLSVLSELKTLQTHFPDLNIETLLQWATYNGAEALDMQFSIGSFQKGLIPGINLLENVDLQNLKFTDKTSVKPLV